MLIWPLWFKSHHMKFKILFLSFCRSNISNVMGCGFNFERFIAQKKIFWFTLPQNDLIFLLSHLYLIMYISMKKIIIIFKIIMIYISIERIFFCFSAKGIFPMCWHVVFIMKDLLHIGKLFLFTLIQKIFIMYLKWNFF